MMNFDPEMLRKLAAEDGSWASAYPELQMREHADLYFMLGVVTAKLQATGVPTPALLAYLGYSLRQGDSLRKQYDDDEPSY
jgi:hypothetical protein